MGTSDLSEALQYSEQLRTMGLLMRDGVLLSPQAQVVTITVKRAVVRYDDDNSKWVMEGQQVIIGSGFALDRFGSSFVVTCGHVVQKFKKADGTYSTIMEALVTPASKYRTVAPGQIDWDTARDLGGIRVEDYRTLHEPNLRKEVQQELFGIAHQGGGPGTECDLAVLRLAQPFLPQEEALQASTDVLYATADAQRKLGLVLGCPVMRPLSPETAIRWPAYSVICTSDQGLIEGRGLQEVLGKSSEGMSGGPHIAHIGNREGMFLSLHMEFLCFSVAVLCAGSLM